MSGVTAEACGFAETLPFAAGTLEAGREDNSSLEPEDLGSKAGSAANCLGDLGKVPCLFICWLGYKMRPLGSVASDTFYWQVLVPLEQNSTYLLLLRIIWGGVQHLSPQALTPGVHQPGGRQGLWDPGPLPYSAGDFCRAL